MNKLVLLAALVMSFSFVSCGWKENPLQDQTEGVKQAKPGDVSEKPQGDEEKALRIDTEDFFNFTEELTSQFYIKGMVYIDKADFEISIENMDQFPGAKFNTTDNVFEWTPPAGFITDFSTKRMSITIVMTTKNVTPVRIKKKTVPVFITPSTTSKTPKIVSVKFDQDKTSVREGEILNFDVVVKDITAVDADGGRPSLTFLPTADGSVEAASIVSMRDLSYPRKNPEVDPNDKTLWTFKMQVNLISREITTSKARMRFVMVTTSRFNVQSQPEYANLDILTNIQVPAISWNQPQEFKAGAKNSFTFTVYDPRGEGDPVFTMQTDCSKIHPKLVCGTCVAKNEALLGRVLYCPISWDIPADYIETTGKEYVNFQMSLSAKSKVYGDNYTSAMQTLSRTIKILPPDPTPMPAPVPGPSPTPTPTPAPKEGVQ